jgi:hypothetical protein
MDVKESADVIYLAQDTAHFRVFVNPIIILQITQKVPQDGLK